MHVEKLARYWSSRRNEEIQIRFRYSHSEVDGCKIVQIHQREEVEHKAVPDIA